MAEIILYWVLMALVGLSTVQTEPRLTPLPGVLQRFSRLRCESHYPARGPPTKLTRTVHRRGGRSLAVPSHLLGVSDIRVLDLLEVRVRVTGWVQCSTCKGSGWVASGRWTGRKTFYEAGKLCPTCLRHKWVPQLSVAGVVPEATSLDLATTDLSVARWPFEVVGAPA